MNKRIRKKLEKKREQLCMVLVLMKDMPDNEGISAEKPKPKNMKGHGCRKAPRRKKVKKGEGHHNHGATSGTHIKADAGKSVRKEFGKGRSHARTSRGLLDGSIR